MFPVSIPIFFPDFHSKEKILLHQARRIYFSPEFIHKHMSPAKITKLLPNDCHYPQKHPFLKYASNTAAAVSVRTGVHDPGIWLPLSSRVTALENSGHLFERSELCPLFSAP